MSSGHCKTWLAWINKLSPISPTISNVSLEEREALASALAIASPGGPVGVQCIDDCRCHDGVPAATVALLYEQLVDRGYLLKGPASRADEFMRLLREAIIVDMTRARVPEIPWRYLGEHGVMVSHRNAEVVHARKQFPRTWQVIEENRA